MESRYSALTVYIAGHVVSAHLTARRLWGTPTALAAWMIAGTLAPDLIDKMQQWLGVTPYGRSVGHSIFVWVALALPWLLIGRRNTPSAAFLLGAYLHLAVDLADDIVEGLERTGWAFSAWMGWPFTNPDMVNVSVPHFWPRAEGIPTALELATIAFWVAITIVRRRDARGR